MGDTLAWAAADAACQAEGLQLATVQSEAQNTLLITAATGNPVWIGGTVLSTIATTALAATTIAPALTAAALANVTLTATLASAAITATWVWSPTNTPLSYTNWGQDEPNNSKENEDCLVLGRDKWNDLDCAEKINFVCQTACPVLGG